MGSHSCASAGRNQLQEVSDVMSVSWKHECRPEGLFMASAYLHNGIFGWMQVDSCCARSGMKSFLCGLAQFQVSGSLREPDSRSHRVQ